MRRLRRCSKPFCGAAAGDVLEIGGGTGQHAVAFASRLPAVTWWPTDLNDNHLRSIAAWRKHAQLENVKPRSASTPARPIGGCPRSACPLLSSAIFCANVIHISPWAVAEGLFAGADRHLVAGGRLFLYGPFKRDGAAQRAEQRRVRREPAQPRIRNGACATPPTCVRSLTANGLRFVELVEMPSNNAILTFERINPA